MNEYPHVLAKIKNSVWMMMPDHLETLLSIANRRLSGERLGTDKIRIELASADHGERQYNTAEVHKGVGLIPLYGPIFPRANLMTMMSGASSLEQFQQDFRMLLNDDDVESIVLDVDSPGGVSDLVHETATEVREGRETKPVYAVANTLCGSAAYYIASQATKLFATPSGNVGSIGAYAVHEDYSVHDAQKGIKTTFIYAGEHKVEGNDTEPLSAEAKDFMQERIDELYGQFIESVALGRGTDVETVEKDFGQGRVYTARKAAEVGMTDGVETLDSVVGTLLAKEQAPSIPQFASTYESIIAPRVRMEVADLEHSEPGTGNPPEPRDTGEVLGGEDRVELPEQPVPDPVTRVQSGGGSMNEELLAQLREAFGMPEADEDTLLAKARELQTESRALEAATVTATQQLAFAEQYPEQAAQLQELRMERREAAAKAFAGRFEKARISVGEHRFGFSGLALEGLESAHLAFASGEGTLELFENTVSKLIAEGGFVNFENLGSDRQSEEDDMVVTPGSQAARIAFAEKVAEIKNKALEDGNVMSQGDAVAKAAAEHPKLAEAWAQTKATQ